MSQEAGSCKPSFTEIFESISETGYRYDQPEKGRNCLAYSKEEDEAHLNFQGKALEIKSLAAEKGLELNIETDQFDNSYAVLVGTSAREIIICSHLDSVPAGGRFDGTLGVAAGLDTINRYVEQGLKPPKTIRVIAFRAEESSVTGHSCLGSSLATGNFDIAKLKQNRHAVLNKNLYELVTKDKLSEEQLQKYQENPYLNPAIIDSVIEVHIEQSQVLETLEKPLGIVIDGIGGARNSDLTVFALTEQADQEELKNKSKILRVTVRGEAGHSGGLPMNGENILGQEMQLRKDALLAAAQFLSTVPQKLKLVNISLPDGGSYNVIPKLCTFEVLVEADFDYTTWQSKLDEILLAGMSADFALVGEAKEVDIIDEKVAFGAMKIIRDCENIAADMAKDTQGQVRAMVGKIKINNAMSITLGINQRRLNNTIAEEMRIRIKNLIDQKSQELGIQAQEANVVSTLATSLSMKIAAEMRHAYKEIFNQENPPELGSMPGHDASKVIRIKKDGNLVPGGMIFVRSLNGGISHDPAEFSTITDMKMACDLLFETVRRIE